MASEQEEMLGHVVPAQKFEHYHTLHLNMSSEQPEKGEQRH